MNRFADFTYHSVYHPIKSIFTEYRRITFMVLLVFVEIFSILLTSVSVYLVYLFYDTSAVSTAPNSKNDRSSGTNWVGLIVVGLCLMTICIIGLRGADLINLDLLLTFFWGIMVFIGPLILACVIGFDFYSYINIFFQHGWSTPSFSGIRKLTCDPLGTADTLCAVPFPFPYSYPVPIYENISDWCYGNFYNVSTFYNSSSDCEHIYNQAFNAAVKNARVAVLAIAIICVVNIAIVILSIYLCYHILTAPIITESMNDIINYLLILPIVCCFAMTWYLWDWRNYTGLPYSWAPAMFLSLGVALSVTLPVGIVGGRRKSRSLLTLYIVNMVLIGAGLAILGIFGILYSSIVQKFFLGQVSDDVLEQAACDKSLQGCCCCAANSTYPGGPRCPEWSNSDILSYLGLDLKIAGVAAFISLLYILGGISVAGLVRLSLKNYKSDYI